MSLFGKKGPILEPTLSDRSTFISDGVNIVGDITSVGSIELDGVLRGDIECRHLVIGPDGMLYGDIVADSLVINGIVHGAIRAKAVKIGTTARVIGDVDHEILEVSKGAEVDGRYKRTPFKTADIKESVKQLSKEPNRAETDSVLLKDQNPADILDTNDVYVNDDVDERGTTH